MWLTVCSQLYFGCENKIGLSDFRNRDRKCERISVEKPNFSFGLKTDHEPVFWKFSLDFGCDQKTDFFRIQTVNQSISFIFILNYSKPNSHLQYEHRLFYESRGDFVTSHLFRVIKFLVQLLFCLINSYEIIFLLDF